MKNNPPPPNYYKEHGEHKKPKLSIQSTLGTFIVVLFILIYIHKKLRISK